jgi:hypothetical protein
VNRKLAELGARSLGDQEPSFGMTPKRHTPQLEAICRQDAARRALDPRGHPHALSS